MSFSQTTTAFCWLLHSSAHTDIIALVHDQQTGLMPFNRNPSEFTRSSVKLVASAVMLTGCVRCVWPLTCYTQGLRQAAGHHTA